MIGMLLTLIIVAVFLGILWIILQHIPVPPPFAWVVQVVFLIICLMALISVFSGGISFGDLGGNLFSRRC